MSTTAATSTAGCLFAGALCLLSAPAGADALDGTYSAPYESCGFCHGYDGNVSTDRFPSIAGQTVAYLTKQLRDYRAGHRAAGGEMTPAARALDEHDLQTVARYFAGQTPRLRVDDESGADLGLGRRLYLRGKPGVFACIACHVPRGRPAPFGYPRVLGQNAAYVRRQMHDYRSGRRRNDRFGVMRSIARRLSAREIAAVSEYAARRL
ncbi:MAG: cytochrome c4 [Gammaproteobacteria bacterium]